MPRLAIAALVVALATSPVAGQPDARQAIVTVAVAPETVAVGERFTVRIRVRAPKVATVTFPELPAPTAGIQAVDPRSVQEGPPGDVLDLTAIYSFVSWETGRRAVAFTPVRVVVAGQERAVAFGAPDVVVRSVLVGDSASQVPREARPPVSLPGGAWRFVLLGSLLAGGLLWHWWRVRRGRRAAAGPAEPEAWQRAAASFAALGTLDLASAGEPGRHVIAHVDVMREYLGRRFPEVESSLDAAGTTATLAAVDFPLSVQRVGALLARDEAVRFAHASVTAADAAVLAQEAREIVAAVQLAHEARLRARERPPRPRRR